MTPLTAFEPATSTGGAPGTFAEAVTWVAGRTWLAFVALTALALWVAARMRLAAWRHRRHTTGARQVTIAPPPQVDPAGAAELWTTLVGVLTPATWRRRLYGIPHVGFEYVWDRRRLTIRLWVPGTIPPGAVEAAVTAAWPGAATTTTPAEPPVPTSEVVATGGALIPTLADNLPLADDHHDDPLRPMLAAGAQLGDADHAAVQILARPATARRARKARAAAGRMRAGAGGDPVARGIGAAARALIEPILWFIGVFLPGPEPRPTAGTTGGGAGRPGGRPAGSGR